MNTLKLKIFIGGSGKDYQSVKELKEKIFAETKKKVKIYNYSQNIDLKLVPPDNVDQTIQDKHAKQADVLFMFMGDGIGQKQTGNKSLFDSNKTQSILEKISKYSTLRKDELWTCSVSEIISALSNNFDEKSLYYYVDYNVDKENDIREKLFNILKKIFNDRSIIKKNYKDINHNNSNNIVIKISNNIIEYINKRIEIENGKSATQKYYETEHNISLYHGKYVDCPYSKMLDLLDKTNNLFSFNLRADLSTFAINGTRKEFGKKLKEKIDNNKIGFTRISTFNSFKKLAEAINEIKENPDKINKDPQINLFFYPYFHFPFVEIENNKTSNIEIYDRASLVLFNINESNRIEYKWAFWGLYPDSENHENVAIQFEISNQMHPIVKYAHKITNDLHSLSPLFVSFPPTQIENTNFFKTGFYSRNFMILYRIIEKAYEAIIDNDKDDSLSDNRKKIKENICDICKEMDKKDIKIYNRKDTKSGIFDFYEKILSLNNINCDSNECKLKEKTK